MDRAVTGEAARRHHPRLDRLRRTSTVDLIARDPASYRVEALVARTSVELLAEQARRLRARLAVVAEPDRYQALKAALAGTSIEVAAGPDAVIEAAERPAEWVMAAVVGFAGLAPTLAAARRGALVALANKEALVCAGRLLIDAIEQSGGVLLPVDSEHNAIFQVFEPDQNRAVDRLILTASGGPFRNWSLADMADVTPEQALAHPNWDMGAKISIDSATMMNKGLGVIEAQLLFGLPGEQVEIVVHPQSIIHSMVAYRDGSVLAQPGRPTCAFRSVMPSGGRPASMGRRPSSISHEHSGPHVPSGPIPAAFRRYG